MSEPSRFEMLVQDLERVQSPLQRLKLLALSWRSFRGLDREQRRALAMRVGLDGAEDLVENLGLSEQASPSAVLRAIRKARESDPEDLRKLITGLRDPARRGRVLRSALAEWVGSGEPPPAGPGLEAPGEGVPPADAVAPAAPAQGSSPPAGGAPARPDAAARPAGEAASAAAPSGSEDPGPAAPVPPSGSPTVSAAKLATLPTGQPAPHPEASAIVGMPAIPAAPAADAHRAAPAVVPPPPRPPKPVEPGADRVPPSPAIPPAAAPPGGDARKTAPPARRGLRADLPARLRAVQGPLRRLRLLRQGMQDLPDLPEPALAELLDGFSPGWPRRRALAALLAAGIPSSLPVARRLIDGLGSAADRRWCLGTILHHWDLLPPERREIERARWPQRVEGP